MSLDRLRRRFARRSKRSRSQDLARQARIVVSPTVKSKAGRERLARWMRTPNRLDVRGVDTRRARTRGSWQTGKGKKARAPSAIVTPPPPSLALPAGQPKGTATRQVKAQVWREFRKLRSSMTPEAYRKAQAVMRSVLVQYTDAEQKREAIQSVRAHFAEEMKRRHKDWGPEWGKRASKSRLRPPTFTPAPGMPKATEMLINEWLQAARAGKGIPRELQKRAREDEYLAETNFRLLPVSNPSRRAALDPVANPHRAPTEGLTVRVDGEVVPFETMSPAERRKALLSGSGFKSRKGRVL